MFAPAPLIYCQCSYQKTFDDIKVPGKSSMLNSRYPAQFSTESPRGRATSSDLPTQAAAKTAVNATTSCTRNNQQLKFGIDAILYGYQQQDSDHISQPPCLRSPSVTNGAEMSKRKRHWSRPVFSQLQRRGLEKQFQFQKYVTKNDRFQLASMLGLSESQIKVWFQNRRTKWKRDMKEKEQENPAK